MDFYRITDQIVKFARIELYCRDFKIESIIKVEVVGHQVAILASTTDLSVGFFFAKVCDLARFDKSVQVIQPIEICLSFHFVDWKPNFFDLNLTKGLVAFSDNQTVALYDIDFE